MPKLKSTTALTWLGHTLATVALLAIFTGSITGYQAVASGNYDWQALTWIIVAAMLGVISKVGSATILNNVNFLPAMRDLLGAAENLTTAAANTSQVPQGPIHVVLHNETPPETIAPIQTPTAPMVHIPQGELPGYYSQPDPQPNILPTPANQVPQVAFPEMPLYFGDSAMMPAVQP